MMIILKHELGQHVESAMVIDYIRRHYTELKNELQEGRFYYYNVNEGSIQLIRSEVATYELAHGNYEEDYRYYQPGCINMDLFLSFNATEMSEKVTDEKMAILGMEMTFTAQQEYLATVTESSSISRYVYIYRDLTKLEPDHSWIELPILTHYVDDLEGFLDYMDEFEN